MNNNKRSIWKDKAFEVFAISCTLGTLLVLALLLFIIAYKGITHINWTFLSSLPSRHVEKTGIYTAIAGMVSVLFVTILISFPIGIGAGIYLEEFVNKKNKTAKILEINIINLDKTEDESDFDIEGLSLKLLPNNLDVNKPEQ